MHDYLDTLLFSLMYSLGLVLIAIACSEAVVFTMAHWDGVQYNYLFVYSCMKLDLELISSRLII